MITILPASAHGEVPRLIVRLAQVFKRQCAPREDEVSVDEVQAVLPAVHLVLRVVPLEPR